MLYRSSKAFRTQLISFMTSIINKEMKKILSPTIQSIWRTENVNKYEQMKRFSWHKAIEETEQFCPVIISLLKSMLCKDVHVLPTTLRPTLGAIFGMMVFARKPTKMKLLQEMIGVQLWLSGATRDV